MKILFLSAWFPSPADNGSKIRIQHLLQALAQRHTITLLSFSDPRETIDPASLNATCQVGGLVPAIRFQPDDPRGWLGFFSSTPRSIGATYSVEMDRLVRRELGLNQYDVVIASQINMARYIPIVRSCPAVFEEVETSMLREAQRHAPDPLARLRLTLTWRKMQRYLRQLVVRFAACTVVSALERNNLRELASEYDRIEIIPNAVDIDRLTLTGVVPEPYQLIYNGALTYGPNYGAIRYFLAEMWPRIKQAVPEASLKITGRTEGVPIDRLPNSVGVSWTGYLTDVRPAVASAWAAIAPLRMGGGTRLKILEAMALGTPVITTVKGAEGLEVVHGRDLLIADNPMDFAEQTIRLLGDPVLRAHLAEHGRQLVRSKYNWQSSGEKINQLIESVAASAHLSP